MNPQAIVGKTVSFVVHCLNAAGADVPDTNGAITVSTDDATSGTATCNPDGTNGVFTALVAGKTVNVTASDGKLTSAPYPIDTITDPALAPASLAIKAT